MNIMLVSISEGCYNIQISILQSKPIASEESITKIKEKKRNKKESSYKIIIKKHTKMKIENKLIKKIM